MIGALASSWGLNVQALSYLPKGGGSYHWVADTSDRGRYFLTGDDLDRKPWLGVDRESAFNGLRVALETALMLHEQAGRAFLVAPIRTRGGESLQRISSQYTLALFPFIDGHTGNFGEKLNPTDRARLLGLLAELHQSTPHVVPRAARRGVELPGRAELENALSEVDRPWAGGPFAEPTRKRLATNADAVLRWLARFDHLTTQVANSDAKLVVTHGEPHPANLIRVEGGLFLIDWDTVGLAPPERDLWMLDDGSADGLRTYTEATGRQVAGTAISLYRLAWRLADLAAFTAVFRSDHQRTADTSKAWRGFTDCLRPNTAIEDDAK